MALKMQMQPRPLLKVRAHVGTVSFSSEDQLDQPFEWDEQYSVPVS